MDKYSLKNKSCENSKQLFILRIWISKQNDKFELLANLRACCSAHSVAARLRLHL